MNSMPRHWLPIYTFAALLHVMSWSMYYSITRAYFSLAGPDFLARLAAAETVPIALGIFWARIAEKRGFRVALLPGFLEALFLLLVGFVGTQPTLTTLFAVCMASLFWSLAGPQTTAIVVTVSPTGHTLSNYFIGSTMGWSLGALAAPLTYQVLGYTPTMVLAGLLTAASYTLYMLCLPAEYPRHRISWQSNYSLILYVVVLSTAIFYVTGIIGSVYLSILYAELNSDNAMYALTLFATGLAGAAVRPIAGKVVDKLGPKKVLQAVLLAYAVYVYIYPSLHGIATVVAWLIPLFPFLDASLYLYTTRILGGALGAATTSAAYTPAGFTLLTISALNTSLHTYRITATLAALAGTLLLTLYRHHTKSLQPHPPQFRKS